MSYDGLTKWRGTTCNGLSNKVYWESVGSIGFEKLPILGVQI